MAIGPAAEREKPARQGRQGRREAAAPRQEAGWGGGELPGGGPAPPPPAKNEEASEQVQRAGRNCKPAAGCAVTSGLCGLARGEERSGAALCTRPEAGGPLRSAEKVFGARLQRGLCSCPTLDPALESVLLRTGTPSCRSALEAPDPQSWWILCRMFHRLDEEAGVFSSLLLCAVCLTSAMQTYQIHRGAGAGFLLQAVVPLLESAAPFAAPLGLDWVSGSPDSAWVSPAVGLSLLAFAFHWLNGDRYTANVLLGGVLLVAASSDYLREEDRSVVAHSVTMLSPITILIVSVFTGNAFGVAGSLLGGTAGLLAGSGLAWLRMLRKGDVLCCLLAAANLTWRWALQVQHQELEQGSVGLLAETFD